MSLQRQVLDALGKLQDYDREALKKIYQIFMRQRSEILDGIHYPIQAHKRERLKNTVMLIGYDCEGFLGMQYVPEHKVFDALRESRYASAVIIYKFGETPEEGEGRLENLPDYARPEEHVDPNSKTAIVPYVVPA